MRRWLRVLFFAVIGVLAYLLYLEFRLPPGTQALGDNDEMIARLGLWSAIAGALASFFSLLKDVLGLFKKEHKE